MQASDFPLLFLRIFAFAWGAIWGSFANVVIYRWPRELSVLRPASHCPHCEKPVRFYDNVPVLAWIWLRGKCRDCNGPISPRYPFVEAIYGVACFAIAERLLRADPDMALSVFLALFMVRFAFVGGLLSAAFVDMETLLIPDFISLGGMVLMLAASALLPGIGWQQSVLGAGLGFAIPFSLYFVWSRFLKREGMGLGDAKLLAMIGALLGPKGVLFSLSVGALQGIFATVLSRVTGWQLGPTDEQLEEFADDEGETEGETADEEKSPPEDPGLLRARIPFGPFLALGAIEYLFGADALVEWWMSFVSPQLR